MFISESIYLCPYSKKLPCTMPFPGTGFYLRVEASCARLFNAQNEVLDVFPFSFSLPLLEISTHLDMERERVIVQGKDKAGFFRKVLTIHKGKISPGQKTPRIEREKLTCGCHKKQETELLLAKGDIRSFLPHLLAIGAASPPACHLSKAAVEFSNLLDSQQGEAIAPWLKRCLQQRTESIFFPSSQVSSSYGEKETSPTLFAELYPLLRSLFVRVEERHITLLPLLPKELFAGKMTNISLGKEAKMDFLFSKKQVSKVLFTVLKPCRFFLYSSKREKSYRLRFGIKDKGKTCLVGEELVFTEPGLYFIDRWQK